MIWPLRKNRSPTTDQEDTGRLTFKGGKEFFEYQCKFGHTSIQIGVAIPAPVLDSRLRFGVDSAVAITSDGRQLASLQVASPEGGFLVFASTPSASGEKLKPGDIVLWVPELHSDELGSRAQDSRTGWIGQIRARVEPSIDPRSPSFIVSSKYD
jgi:hypothetical protein